MLELYFLKHAKSDWESFDGNNFNRNISVKGVKKQEKLVNFLESKEFFYDKILCSPPL